MKAELTEDKAMLTVHLTPDEALSLVAGPVVEGRDVSYAESEAYGKVWAVLGRAPEAVEHLAERLEGTDPLTVEEAETALTIIDYWLEAVEKAGVGMEVGRGEYEPLRAKLRARLAREDA